MAGCWNKGARLKIKAMLYQRIVNVVSKYFNAPADAINPYTHFMNDLNADSLDMVEFTIEVEREFNFLFNDEDIEKIRVVADVMHYLTQPAAVAA